MSRIELDPSANPKFPVKAGKTANPLGVNAEGAAVFDNLFAITQPALETTETINIDANLGKKYKFQLNIENGTGDFNEQSPLFTMQDLAALQNAPEQMPLIAGDVFTPATDDLNEAEVAGAIDFPLEVDGVDAAILPSEAIADLQEPANISVVKTKDAPLSDELEIAQYTGANRKQIIASASETATRTAETNPDGKVNQAGSVPVEASSIDADKSAPKNIDKNIENNVLNGDINAKNKQINEAAPAQKTKSAKMITASAQNAKNQAAPADDAKQDDVPKEKQAAAQASPIIPTRIKSDQIIAPQATGQIAAQIAPEISAPRINAERGRAQADGHNAAKKGERPIPETAMPTSGKTDLPQADWAKAPDGLEMTDLNIETVKVKPTSAGPITEASDQPAQSRVQPASGATQPTAQAPLADPGRQIQQISQMLHVLDTRDQQWGNQLADQMRMMTQRGQMKADLVLKPKSLGTIKLSLDLIDNETHVRVVTETSAAARLLIGAEDRLSQMLEQSGLKLAGFDARGGNDTGANSSFNGSGHEQNSSDNPPNRKSKISDANAAPSLQGSAKAHDTSNIDMIA